MPRAALGVSWWTQDVLRDRLPSELEEPAFSALGVWGGWSLVSRFSPHKVHRPCCLESRHTV